MKNDVLSEKKGMRVLVADGRPEVRSALRLLLEQNVDSLVTGEATNAEDLLAQLAEGCPDLILLDCEIPTPENFELLPILRSLCPKTIIIALGCCPEAQCFAGADTFVSKRDSPEHLVATLMDCLRRCTLSPEAPE